MPVRAVSPSRSLWPVWLALCSFYEFLVLSTLCRVPMQQYGYNPLAGGLLTGAKNVLFVRFYQDRLWTNMGKAQKSTFFLGKYSGMDDPALDEKGRFSSEYAGGSQKRAARCPHKNALIISPRQATDCNRNIIK